MHETSVAPPVITAKHLLYGLAYGGILYVILILRKEFLDSCFIHWKVFLIFLICLLVILYREELMAGVIIAYVFYSLPNNDD